MLWWLKLLYILYHHNMDAEEVPCLLKFTEQRDVRKAVHGKSP